MVQISILRYLKKLELCDIQIRNFGCMAQLVRVFDYHARIGALDPAIKCIRYALFNQYKYIDPTFVNVNLFIV